MDNLTIIDYELNDDDTIDLALVDSFNKRYLLPGFKVINFEAITLDECLRSDYFKEYLNAYINKHRQELLEVD